MFVQKEATALAAASCMCVKEAALAASYVCVNSFSLNYEKLFTYDSEA